MQATERHQRIPHDTGSRVGVGNPSPKSLLSRVSLKLVEAFANKHFVIKVAIFVCVVCHLRCLEPAKEWLISGMLIICLSENLITNL